MAQQDSAVDRSQRLYTFSLPTQLTSFVGREREISEVRRLIVSARLVTLTGAGGCGKTRLALRVASEVLDDYADGVCWVELAPLTDSTLVPQAVAKALGLYELPNQPISETLANYLATKQLLLVLDNCEHLIGACTQLSEMLLRNCPDLKILATSREALSIGAEQLWLVPPLSLPDSQHSLQTGMMARSEAVRLLIERARAVKPEFVLTDENGSAVQEICKRLDGIPLAIELAAARMKVLSVEQIVARLDDRFNLLNVGNRTALQRHQTLRALIDWSYDLLPEAERVLLQRLAVFVGGCTLEAAESVCAGEHIERRQILDLLTHLVDKSLVLVEEHGGAARFRMLETIRQYASEKLQASGEHDWLRNSHLTYFLKFTEEAEPHITSAARQIWLIRLDAEHDNLRAALEWTETCSDLRSGLRLAGALAWFWRFTNYSSEGRRWLERALATHPDHSRSATDPNELRYRAKALLGAGLLAWGFGNFHNTRALLEESLVLFRQIGDRRSTAHVLTILGAQVGDVANEFTRARPLLQESVTILRALVREDGVAWDQWWLAYALNRLGEVTHHNDLAGARPILDEALALARRLSDIWLISQMLMILGSMDAKQGDFVSAHARFEESLSIFRESGSKRNIAWALGALGDIARYAGHYGQAAPFYTDGLTLYRETGHPAGISWMLYSLGCVALHYGESKRAAELFAESLVLRNEIGHKEGIAEALDGLAGVAAISNQPEHAARLAGAAEAQRQSMQDAIRALYRMPHDPYLPIAQAQLDEEKFSAAWAEGMAMTVNQAIDYALAEPMASSEPVARSRAAKKEFGGLTAREREVAALIAKGNSNRAIARELVVEVKTVEVHITHILDKLGFASRTQIAGWAISKGLAPAPRDLNEQLQ